VCVCVCVVAFGCRSVVPPEGAVITQHGDDVAVVCNQSLEVFYVTCSADNVWVGELGNCSRAGKLSPTFLAFFSFVKQEAQLTLTNPRDAFRSRSRSLKVTKNIWYHSMC